MQRAARLLRREVSLKAAELQGGGRYWLSSGRTAHMCSDHREFDGFFYQTSRRVVQTPCGMINVGPSAVTIDIYDMVVQKIYSLIAHVLNLSMRTSMHQGRLQAAAMRAQ